MKGINEYGKLLITFVDTTENEIVSEAINFLKSVDVTAGGLLRTFCQMYKNGVNSVNFNNTNFKSENFFF